MNKKIATYLLFSLLIAPFAIAITFIHFSKNQIRKEVKEQIIHNLDKSELVFFQLSLKEYNELDWENEEEFELKGKMYDVVEVQKLNKTMQIWCWADNDESELNAKLDQLIHFKIANKPFDNQNKEQLKEFLKSLYFTGEYILVLKVQVVLLHQIQINYYKSLEHKITSPPPKFC